MTDSGTDSGTESGTESETDSGTDPGTDSGVASGTGPELDLTPATPELRPRRRWLNWSVLAVFALAGGFVLYQALTSARVYFLNVDEAVARQESLGDETFRMQGTVIAEPRAAADGALLFTLGFGGEEAEIRHVGDEPSDLFRLGQPVVAEGRWEGDHFLSSQVVVKHSEEYVEDNPNRVEYDLDRTVLEEAERP